MNSGLVILDLCEVGGGYMPKRVALLTLGAEPGRDTVDITELAEMDKSSGQIGMNQGSDFECEFRA
jgi:hypothetical protein